MIRFVSVCALSDEKPFLIAFHSRNGTVRTHRKREQKGLFAFPGPHSERHQEPAWAARKKSPTLPSPAGVCRGNCKRGIPVVILASGETNRMMNESLGQAALGLGQQYRYQMEQVHSMGYSPLGKVCLEELK
jgi:hypothetical protein